MSFDSTKQSFVITGGYVILQDPTDKRSTKDWCLADLNIAGYAWDTTLRGHVLNNTVTFYTGGDMYTPDTSLTLMEAYSYRDQLMELNAIYDDTGAIYNGVRPQYGQDTEWPHVFMADRKNSRWTLAKE